MMEDEIDPLDAYMQTIDKTLQKEKTTRAANGEKGIATAREPLEELEESHSMVEPIADDAELAGIDLLNAEELIALAQKKVKKKDLTSVDHAAVQYEPFRKNFYVETSQIAKMTDEQIKAYRFELDNIKIRVSEWVGPYLYPYSCSYSFVNELF